MQNSVSLPPATELAEKSDLGILKYKNATSPPISGLLWGNLQFSRLIYFHLPEFGL